MTHPIGYYTGYDPKTQEPVILDKLQERFGSQLQRMTYEQKIVFRAALTGFIAQLPVWKEDGNDITCIDCLLSLRVWTGISGMKTKNCASTSKPVASFLRATSKD